VNIKLCIPKTSRYLQSAILLLGAASSFVLAQLDFAARRDLAIGATPHGIVVADINGDGKKDILAANSSSNSFSILLGVGGGVYKPEVRKATAGYPSRLVVASFNSNTDSFLDVVVACDTGDSFQFFPGNGAGGFGSPVTFTTGAGSHPAALGVLDFNNDLKNDLVVVLNGTNAVRLYSGNGAGGFTLFSTLTVDLSPVDITLGDWDGDFRTDIAVVSELDTSGNGSVTVAYGCPTGFCFPVVQSVGLVPASITSGLLNNDTYPDLVVGSRASGNLSILYGDPDFGFSAAVPLAVGGNSQAAAVSDMNGDGNMDISVALELSRGQGAAQVLLGNGLGSYTAGSIYAVGSLGGGIATSDIGGSASPDLLTTNVTAGSISLLLGNGAGGFSNATPFFIVGGADSSVSSLDTADMNADGKADLAVARTDLNNLDVFFGSGTGTFSAGPVLILPGSQDGDAAATAVIVRSFTTDSLLDIAVLNAGPENLSVFPGTGPGTFGSRVDYGLGNNCNTSTGAGCVTPENLADGPLNDTDTTHPDLIVANSGGDGGSFPFGSISVFLQSGGGFGAATRYTGGANPICTGGVNAGLTCASNLDCRGRCSIDTTTPCSDDPDCPSGQTCSNPGPGTCTISPKGAAVGLVNADGNRDVMVCENATNKTTLLPGNGTGAFATAGTTLSVGAGPRIPLLKDLDFDGDLDLVALNNGDSTISTFLGDNAGNFAAVGTVPAGRNPWRGVLADFNQDGWDDLAAANITAGCAGIMLGDGAGHFGVPIRFGAGATPSDIATADFNADGKPDLALSNVDDGNVSILLNASQPPILNIAQVAGGTQVSWSPVFEASSYDVIRGDRSLITQTATQVNLGTVTCIENDSPNADTVGNEDNNTPPVGTSYFYLFRTQDPQVKGSYGRSTLNKVRVAGAGNCL
jgi:hypothetical protein